MADLPLIRSGDPALKAFRGAQKLVQSLETLLGMNEWKDSEVKITAAKKTASKLGRKLAGMKVIVVGSTKDVRTVKTLAGEFGFVGLVRVIGTLDEVTIDRLSGEVTDLGLKLAE